MSPMPKYLTTRELADLLRIKERKVYDLAAAGEVPCARVTGKLLFPAGEIEAWLAAGRSGPEVGALPNVFLGSHDPLLDWALRESRCGLATFFDGSLDGLSRFVAREGVASGLHIHVPADGSWNVAEVARQCGGANAVLIGFAMRRRGLVLASGAEIEGLDDLPGCRFIPRQPESGSQPLLTHMLTTAGVDVARIEMSDPARSETDAALAVLRGDVDAAFGLEALAAEYRLGFVPLIEERFDLLIDRRAWFEPPLQAFLGFCRSEAFARRAADLKGYDVAECGVVRWNGV